MPQQEADKQPQAEAANPATSAQCLETLSSNPHLRSAIAGNPAAPTQVLEQLATDQDAQVREQVAGNPNTPWPILERLAWEFPRQFLHNSVGPLQILAHPEQISINEAFGGALAGGDDSFPVVGLAAEPPHIKSARGDASAYPMGGRDASLLWRASAGRGTKGPQAGSATDMVNALKVRRFLSVGEPGVEDSGQKNVRPMFDTISRPERAL